MNAQKIFLLFVQIWLAKRYEVEAKLEGPKNLVDDWEQVSKWFRSLENNELSEKVEIREGKFGRGLFAKEKITDGEKIMTIGRNSQLTPQFFIEV